MAIQFAPVVKQAEPVKRRKAVKRGAPVITATSVLPAVQHFGLVTIELDSTGLPQFVGVRLDAATLAAVDAAARASGVTRSAFIRAAIEARLKR